MTRLFFYLSALSIFVFFDTLYYLFIVSNPNSHCTLYNPYFSINNESLLNTPSSYILSAENPVNFTFHFSSLVKFLSSKSPKNNSIGWTIGQMVTCSHRVNNTLTQAVISLQGQLDKLLIYFNDIPANSSSCGCQFGLDNEIYKGSLPSILDQDWIFVSRASNNLLGNIGDRGKVYFSSYGPTSYRFLLDDDIKYPPDYIKRMSAVCVHCSIMAPNATSIWDHVDNNHRHFQVGRRKGSFPDFVNYGGTATVSYHTDTLNLSFSEFPIPNMADIFFSLHCQRNQIPIFCIDRPLYWLKAISDPFLFKKDLWSQLIRRQHPTILQRLSSYFISLYPHWRIYRPIINNETVKTGLY